MSLPVGWESIVLQLILGGGLLAAWLGVFLAPKVPAIRQCLPKRAAADPHTRTLNQLFTRQAVILLILLTLPAALFVRSRWLARQRRGEAASSRRID